MSWFAKILSYGVVYSISLFYGVLVLGGMLVKAIRNGSFGPKKRHRESKCSAVQRELQRSHSIFAFIFDVL